MVAEILPASNVAKQILYNCYARFGNLAMVKIYTVPPRRAIGCLSEASPVSGMGLVKPGSSLAENYSRPANFIAASVREWTWSFSYTPQTCVRTVLILMAKCSAISLYM